MFALLNVDTDQYISSTTRLHRIAPGLDVYYNADEEHARRWKTETGAQRTLDRLYADGSIPGNVDVRVVEVDDVW